MSLHKVNYNNYSNIIAYYEYFLANKQINLGKELLVNNYTFTNNQRRLEDLLTIQLVLLVNNYPL